MSTVAPPTPESIERFACFGGTCAVLIEGSGPAGTAPIAAGRVKRRLLGWHTQFSRFEETSELCRLNRDPRERVSVSAMMARFVEAALRAAAITGGLVDPTLLADLEQAGYAHDFSLIAGANASPASPAGAARAAAPHPAAAWRRVVVDRSRQTVSRPAGVRLDSGGIAKGLFGDVLAPLLAWHPSYALEVAGDVRLGGADGVVRPIQIISPFNAGVVHTFELTAGAAATSGTTKRSWVDDRGRRVHHLLDPSTGQPAFTGVVQATALAPTGVEAEALAKAALLAGREGAVRWLRHGGVVVYEDGASQIVEPRLSEGLR